MAIALEASQENLAPPLAEPIAAIYGAEHQLLFAKRVCLTPAGETEEELILTPGLRRLQPRQPGEQNSGPIVECRYAQRANDAPDFDSYPLNFLDVIGVRISPVEEWLPATRVFAVRRTISDHQKQVVMENNLSLGVQHLRDTSKPV